MVKKKWFDVLAWAWHGALPSVCTHVPGARLQRARDPSHQVYGDLLRRPGDLLSEWSAQASSGHEEGSDEGQWAHRDFQVSPQSLFGSWSIVGVSQIWSPMNFYFIIFVYELRKDVACLSGDWCSQGLLQHMKNSHYSVSLIF